MAGGWLQAPEGQSLAGRGLGGGCVRASDWGSVSQDSTAAEGSEATTPLALTPFAPVGGARRGAQGRRWPSVLRRGGLSAGCGGPASWGSRVGRRR